jgi:hypothetical protein
MMSEDLDANRGFDVRLTHASPYTDFPRKAA